MFYDRLKQVCTSQGKSPSSVAQAIGMSKANVTGWKNGASPKILTVARLAVNSMCLLLNSSTKMTRKAR